MQTPYQYQLDELYRNQRRQEAEAARRAHEAQANRSTANPVYAPLLAELGRRLSRLGDNLQEQYETPGSLVTES